MKPDGKKVAHMNESRKSVLLNIKTVHNYMNNVNYFV